MPGFSLEIDNQVVRKWVWHCRSSNMGSVTISCLQFIVWLEVMLLTVEPSANIVIAPGTPAIV